MVNLTSKQKFKFLPEAIFQSIVKIKYLKNEEVSFLGIGFFISIDTILTCTHIFVDNKNLITDSKQFSIINLELDEEYEIINLNHYREFNISTFQVKIYDDRAPSLELDSNYDNGIYYIFSLEADSKFSKPLLSEVSIRDNKYDNNYIRFFGQNIKGNWSGSPIFNPRSGKVFGIATSLESPRVYNHKNQETEIFVRSTQSIFKVQEIRKRYDHYHYILSNLPIRPYRKFIGRDSEINQILQYLSPNYRQNMIIVEGSTGIGKTSMVIKLAYLCLITAYYQRLQGKGDKPNFDQKYQAPPFDVIVMASFKNNKNFSSHFTYQEHSFPNVSLLFIIRCISDTLRAPQLIQFYENQNLELVYDYLATFRTLLIIDGLNDLASSSTMEILDFLSRLPRSTKAIITTRQKSILSSHITLKNLSNIESKDFILEEAKLKGVNISEDKAYEIGNLLKGLPIAMIYAIGLCSEDNIESFINNFASDPIISHLSLQDVGKFCFSKILEFIKNSPAYYLLLSLAFFHDRATKEALINVSGLRNKSADLEADFLQLQKLSVISKSLNAEGCEVYSILPITRDYILDELSTDSEIDADFEISARSRWIKFYKQLVEKYGGENLTKNEFNCQAIEEELENIGEVLFWCADHDHYTDIIKIWEAIDPYIVEKKYWMIRFHWWQYLESESQKRAEIKTYVNALTQMSYTWIKFGKQHCDKAKDCLEKAAFFNNDKSVQNKLSETLVSLEKFCGDMSIQS